MGRENDVNATTAPGEGIWVPTYPVRIPGQGEEEAPRAPTVCLRQLVPYLAIDCLCPGCVVPEQQREETWIFIRRVSERAPSSSVRSSSSGHASPAPVTLFRPAALGLVAPPGDQPPSPFTRACRQPFQLSPPVVRQSPSLPPRPPIAPVGTGSPVPWGRVKADEPATTAPCPRPQQSASRTQSVPPPQLRRSTAQFSSAPELRNAGRRNNQGSR